MSLLSCKSHIKEYCANCSFAGVRFIADDSKHWFERLFWIVLVILSWYGSALLIIATWDAFVNNPISFGVETIYTDWDTKMPTVAVCETGNTKMIYNVSDTIWTTEHLSDLEAALKDIAYFRGVAYELIRVCGGKKPDTLCPLSNYSYYANLIRSECPQVLANCSYDDQVFNCCDYFQPIDTDMGGCFIINSIQTKTPKPYPMVNNKKQKLGVLKFDGLLHSMVYTLGEDEVPTITTLHSAGFRIIPGNKYRRHVAVRNIENNPLIVKTTVKQRACRFHSENEGGLYPHYSYSACTVQCRKRAQIAMCRCIDHFMLDKGVLREHCFIKKSKLFDNYKDTNIVWKFRGAYGNREYLGTLEDETERCNITGIRCLQNHENYLTALKPKWALRAGLACNCLQSCDETEITVIKDIKPGYKSITDYHYLQVHLGCWSESVVAARITYRPRKTQKRTVEIILAHLPTERFKRNVVRSSLDLVVSIGSTAGLFVGASLLSFVELIFYFTIRFIGNIWITRHRTTIITNHKTSQIVRPINKKIKRHYSGFKNRIALTLKL